MALYVVKVQFGESLRRLSLGEDVAFSFAHLVGRTRDLFQVPANAQLGLTYVDRDGDVVTMAEDQDLQDALVFQSLNPLRVSAAIVGNEVAAADMMVDDERSAEVKLQLQHLQREQLQLQRERQRLQLAHQRELQQRQDMRSADEKAPDAAGETEPVHYGITCDDCGVRNIRGPRHKSLKREDYDLCEKCFAKPGVNPDDYITVRRGRPDRRPLFNRGYGPGCDSRNPNNRHHRHGFHHAMHPAYRRGRHGCPMAMGVPGNGRFTGEQGQAPPPTGSEAVHYGVTCDECNASPIVGPRFKSNKRYNYDLCQICMQRAGAGAADDYTRTEQPPYSQYLHPHMLMGKYFRTFPPYNMIPFTPYGRPRCPRRIQLMGMMPREEDREVESFSTTVASPLHSAQPTEGAAQQAPSQATKEVEVLMADAVLGSDVRERPSQEQNRAPPVTGTEEVVMAEAYGKVGNTNNNTGGMPLIDESQKASDAQEADITEKAQEDVATYEGMVAKLASMGFTDNKLNEELLKKNNFDLRMTLDDLCAAEDWDHILEELQEMGFYDSDLNRRLLVQNNGSVKRVVKELVQRANGEESSFSKGEGKP